MEPVKKILVCRTDSLKSLVLTSPVFPVLKNMYPEATLGVLVRPSTVPFLRNNPYVDELIVDDEANTHRGASGFIRLSKEIENYRFDTAILPHSNWRLLSLTVSAGIKRRIANGFRPYLPLINKPVWIHKHHPPIHETSYVMSFIAPIANSSGGLKAPEVYLSKLEKNNAAEWLSGKGISPSDKVIGINPVGSEPLYSMSLDMWVKFAKEALASTGADKVLITGGRKDIPVAGKLVRALGKVAVSAAGELNLRDLCAVQSRLHLFIAPDCGFLHTAAASGAPVIGLFPPLITISKEQWKPLNPQAVIIRPKLDKPCIKCSGIKCRLYPCLDTITVSDLGKALNQLNL